MHVRLSQTALGAAAAAALMFTGPAFAQDEMGEPAAEAPAAESAPSGEAAGAQPAAEGGLTLPGTVADNLAAESPNVTDLSYALGYVVGNGYGRNNVELEPQEFARGMEAGLSEGEPRLSEERMQQILMAFEQQLRQQQMSRMQEQAQQGQQFLQTNQAKEGVQQSASGLQYQVLEEGEGESPSASDTVRVHYRGTLVDGTQFDSSYDRGEPAEFPVDAVIPGWTEALQLMKPGAKYRLVIPPNLAYGQEGRPPVIPPSSVLIFDVELLDVLPDAGQ